MENLSEELFEKFDALTCRLSPENLACDGEISQAEVGRRFRQIRKEWKALEKESGRSVSQDEIETESFRRISEERARMK